MCIRQTFFALVWPQYLYFLCSVCVGADHNVVRGVVGDAGEVESSGCIDDLQDDWCGRSGDIYNLELSRCVADADVYVVMSAIWRKVVDSRRERECAT